MSPRVAGVALVLAGMGGQQFGSALAAVLFDRVGPAGAATLRLTISTVLLLAICRPAVRGHSRGDWAVAVGFGAALAAMNLSFYEAIARLPLGPAVTIEVLGPLLLSAVSSRRPVGWLWAALALAGVGLLGGGGFRRLDPVGVAFALGAAAMWAAYILLSARAGGRFSGVDGLAWAMAAGTVLIGPLGLVAAGPRLADPAALGLGAVVAVLSSVFPYSLELLALRRLPAAVFGVLTSLAPATAALAGLLVLGQRLSTTEVAAVLLVVVASAGAVRTGEPPGSG